MQIIIQYIYEIFSIIIFVFFLLVERKISCALFIGLLTYIFAHLLFGMVNSSVKPKHILYLYKNEICMKYQFQHGKSKVEDYLNEIEFIYKYAKLRNMPKLTMETHFAIANKLIERFVYDNDKYKKLCDLSEKEKLTVPSDIGELEITYLGQRINRCARYKYSLIMKNPIKELRRTLEKRPFYKIVINLEESNKSIENTVK